MTDTFIPVSSAQAANLFAPSPPKSITYNNVTYSRTYLNYNYGTPQSPKISGPLFEVKGTATVRKSSGDKKDGAGSSGNPGKMTWKLNMRVSDARDLEGFRQLDQGVIAAITKYKGQFRQHDFDERDHSRVRAVCFRQTSDEGKPIEGADSILSLKMEMNKTAFYRLVFEFDMKGQPIIDPKTNVPKFTQKLIDYKSLEDMSFECGLVFSLRDLYCSNDPGKFPSPSVYVRTCWLTSQPISRGSVCVDDSFVIRDLLLNSSPEDLKMRNADMEEKDRQEAPEAFVASELMQEEEIDEEYHDQTPVVYGKMGAAPVSHDSNTLDLSAYSTRPAQQYQPQPQQYQPAHTGQPNSVGQPRFVVGNM